MKRNRADKVLLSTMPNAPANEPMTGRDRGSDPSSPYQEPNQEPNQEPSETRPRIAPRRPRRWQPKENILQVAAATGRLETLRQAIAAADFTAALSQTGPFTLFAPTDKAFAKLPSADLRALLADKRKLHELLSYHLVPSKVRAPRHQRPSSARTLGGRNLEISVVPEDGGYRVGEARIVKTNIRASNGVIHAIDTVLTPR